MHERFQPPAVAELLFNPAYVVRPLKETGDANAGDPGMGKSRPLQAASYVAPGGL